MPQFDYQTAFSRNIGWVTQEEQDLLRTKRVAIAGLGGVGGSHLLTLARLGIGAFNVADLDVFELANFNRQAGAYLSTINQPKTDTLVRMARDINPELDIKVFNQGVDSSNVDTFLEGVDAYVDGLDYFAVDIRRLVFASCAMHRIPATTAAPLGMGAAVLNFMPGKMTFEDYFQLEGYSELEQLIRFLVGLSPAMLQRSYLVIRNSVDLARHRGPSTPMACAICAGMAGTEVLKIILGRGPMRIAPKGTQFDAYRNRLVKSWRFGGNANPMQLLAIKIAKSVLSKRTENSA